ncbi:MAG: indolepyruvate oxidoreductase subunit beta [Desulfobacteraceae bacterium]|jgi:indolepyruvate ferredoxin oxidoreductase beta subunit|nr:indolepyruvate oxidoreductase subunit beta [Desulfobacteraceae bacterium]
MKGSTNVVITGVGGQGNVLAARLLAIVALKKGLEVAVGDVYGLTQRGGSVASHVRWSEDRLLPPLVPQRAMDILIAFEPLEALRVQVQFGHTATEALVNDSPVMPIGVQAGRFLYPRPDDLWSLLREITGSCRKIPGSEAARALGNIQTLNSVMLGALCGSGLTEFEAGTFEETIRAELPTRFRDVNLDAFQRGFALGCSEDKSFSD